MAGSLGCSSHIAETQRRGCQEIIFPVAVYKENAHLLAPYSHENTPMLNIPLVQHKSIRASRNPFLFRAWPIPRIRGSHPTPW